jgi:hypothetical protein
MYIYICIYIHICIYIYVCIYIYIYIYICFFFFEGANEYNIWYGKYVGDNKDKSFLREAAEDRCVMQKDAGYTKADSSKEKRFFCLHFARGMCAKGSELISSYIYIHIYRYIYICICRYIYIYIYKDMYI